MNSPIEIHFLATVDTLTLNESTTFVIGNQCGYSGYDHEFILDSLNHPTGVRLYPAADFKIGEIIQLILTGNVQFPASPGFTGFAWSFTAETRNGSANFSS